MRVIILLGLLCSFLSAEPREALLIGNSNYQYISKLKNPKADLTRLKTTLESLGFTVKIKTNLNSENLEEAIDVFAKRLAKNRSTTGFLYYTGHGCQVERQGYLLPTNVDSTKRIKVKHNALKINEMIETLKESGNRVNMFFLDACRDVPVGTKGSSKGLGQIKNTPKGTLVVYATKDGETAEDNSDFINSIISSVQEPKQNIRNLPYSISDIFKGTSQTPIFSAVGIPMIVLNTKGGYVEPKKPRVVPVELLDMSEPRRKYSLTISTVPITKKIYITNIKPKYKNGIMLEKGKYTIKIKEDGYEVETFKIDLKSNVTRKVVLKKKKKLSSKNIVRIGNLMYQNQPFRKKYTWQEAKKYCQGLRLGGYSDWKLPNKKELKNLLTKKDVKGQEYRYYIRKEFVRNLRSYAWFWTSTTYEKDSSVAWYVYFFEGYDYRHDKSNNYYALCVR